jgi:hypothetical protein
LDLWYYFNGVLCCPSRGRIVPVTGWNKASIIGFEVKKYNNLRYFILSAKSNKFYFDLSGKYDWNTAGQWNHFQALFPKPLKG